MFLLTRPASDANYKKIKFLLSQQEDEEAAKWKLKTVCPMPTSTGVCPLNMWNKVRKPKKFFISSGEKRECYANPVSGPVT